MLSKLQQFKLPGETADSKRARDQAGKTQQAAETPEATTFFEHQHQPDALL